MMHKIVQCIVFVLTFLTIVKCFQFDDCQKQVAEEPFMLPITVAKSYCNDLGTCYKSYGNGDNSIGRHGLFLHCRIKACKGVRKHFNQRSLQAAPVFLSFCADLKELEQKWYNDLSD
ncbi:uncharacterized protein LOC123296718 [Chrysoperla carnea]|uniref:uncharacterized protein LOC123296718 n=1 Tax=Chrysoperla carnea TaxID=189513 RepID=UPI001D065B02|nr:uncharacterized protein LOC123296718 [Chrysoperla carnea]